MKVKVITEGLVEAVTDFEVVDVVVDEVTAVRAMVVGMAWDEEATVVDVVTEGIEVGAGNNNNNNNKNNRRQQGPGHHAFRHLNLML